MSTETVCWLKRSNLALVYKVWSFELHTMPQNQDIKRVIHKAIDLAHFTVIFSASGTANPMNTDHLEKMCYEACVNAASQLGYNGEGDIEHRLVEGNHDEYSTPMKHLVSVYCSKSFVHPFTDFTPDRNVSNTNEK